MTYQVLRQENLTSSIKTATRISVKERLERISRLRALMLESGIDGTLLVAGNNLRYYLGIPWQATERMVAALITHSEILVICPKFEDTALYAVSHLPTDFCFWEEHELPWELLASHVAKGNVATLALDPECPFWLFDRIRTSHANGLLVSAEKMIHFMRARKSDNELALLQQAKSITLEVHKLVYAHLKPGMRTSEIKKFIDEAHRQLGADNGSYFCAVQFAEGTSHPHGVPGDPILEANQLILIDTGCEVDGYHSDITRTYALDKVSAQIEDIWNIEKQAQISAFEAAAPGVPCSVVDATAREVLCRYNLGPDYTLPGLPHRTGHGIGLDIHEGPYLVKGDETILARGMCFSNEPMIVVPDQFGVRLEDHFYITDTAARWFTEPQKSLYSPF